MGIKNFVKQRLININNIRYGKALRERSMSYHQWVTEREKGLEKEVNPANSQPFVVFCVSGGRVSEYAMALLDKLFREQPEVMVAYGDEDVWKPGKAQRQDPWFKPEWSPHLLGTQFYLGNMIAVRRSFYRQRKSQIEAVLNRKLPLGSLFKMERVSEYQRLVLCCINGLDEASGYGVWESRKAVRHLPKMLFHCNSREIMEQCRQLEQREPEAAPASQKLSIIIPSKDQVQLLETCLQALDRALGDIQAEVIVVDNGSTVSNREAIEQFLRQYSRKNSYLYHPMQFNFSAMCNLGAQKAENEILLFLNDDVELCCEDALQRMLCLACRKEVGAVGLKLYYPDSVRIQHAGITNLPMGPVHKLQFLEDSQSYYFDWNKGVRNFLAVTAACLMVGRGKFQEVGGFAEELSVAFNDVDLCFSLYERGYDNVCVSDSYAWHHESISRGDDESEEKLARLLEEKDRLYRRHPDLRGTDPYYPEGLSRQGLDTRVRPAFETAGNVMQRTEGRLQSMKGELLSKFRENACLMVRVESVEREEAGLGMVGWGVVLGDNNACYQKELLFADMHESGAERIYRLPLKGQYRPDLVENMTDQVNVGLCGYMVCLGNGVLPAGRFRVGMAAKNCVTGAGLVNWSNRVIEI